MEQETIIDTYKTKKKYTQRINHTPNNEQSAIIKKFKQVLRQDGHSPENDMDKPSIFLLTSTPGAETILIVHLIIDKAKSIENFIVGTSYNGISAVFINGDTISDLLNQYITEREKQRKDNTLFFSDVKEFTYEKMAQFKENLKIDILSLLIVDKISTVSPIVHATLNIKLRLSTNIYNKHFGRIPILFVGDFSQLLPVMENSLTKKLLSSLKTEKEKEKMNTTVLSNLLTNNNEIEDKDKYLWQRGCNVFKKFNSFT